jgi:hypothetical protein
MFAVAMANLDFVVDKKKDADRTHNRADCVFRRNAYSSLLLSQPVVVLSQNNFVQKKIS